MTHALGIDVSSHNGLFLDFPRIEEAGYSFVILRHSVGVSKDTAYDRNLAEIKKTGLLVGAYHYVWASASVASQVDAFLQHNFADTDLPPVLDIEQIEITEANVTLFLREIERLTGRVPMIYTRKNIWESIVPAANRDKYKKYFLWVAQYTDPVGEYPTAVPSTWSSWNFWQFTSEGRVPGHTGNIDVNVYNGDLEALCCRFRYPKPVLKWPVDSDVVTQIFGNNPNYYGPLIGAVGLGHEGLDMRAPTGANVYACADGVVKAVITTASYGLNVRIDHQDGIESTYAHLQQSLVAVGQRVVAGQRIALADNTGNSAGSHLHLTVKADYATALGLTAYPNDIINPTPYLQVPVASPIGVQMRNKSGLILNIRALPSITSADIGDIPVGAIVIGFPPATNDYLSIKYEGIQGYALAKHFEVVEVQQPVLLRSTAQPYVNIRSGPSTGFSDIGDLAFGETIMGFPVAGQAFWKVVYGSVEAWIASEYLVVVEQ